MSPVSNPAAGGPALESAPAAHDMREVLARMAEFSQLGPAGGSTASAPLDLFSDISLTLTARLGTSIMTIGDLLKLGPGATVELDREVSQPVELVVGGKVFARGDVVVVNDRFGIRIKELANTRESVGSGTQ